MKLARSVILLSGLGLSLTLDAATEFDDGLVPIELVNEFIGGQFYSSLPDNFPVPELPADAGLSVIGSLDHGGVMRQVLLRSSGNWEETSDMLRAAYEAGGWLDISREGPDLGIRGNPMQLSLCHDALGSLDFRVTGENLLRVSHRAIPLSSRPGGLDCAQLKALNESRDEGQVVMDFIRELMPVLEVPANTVPRDPRRSPFVGISGGFTSMSGSGLDFHMDKDGEIEVPGSSVAALYEHFAAQLETQGWQLDAGALGTGSAASIWLKTARTPEAPGSPAEDIDLTGIMSILHAGEDDYRIMFRLTSRTEGTQLNVPEIGIRGISPIGIDNVIRDFPPIGIDALGPPVHTPELGIRGIPPSGRGYISGTPNYRPIVDPLP